MRWLLLDYSDPNLPIPLRRRLRASLRALPVYKLPKALQRSRFWLGAWMMLWVLSSLAVLVLPFALKARFMPSTVMALVPFLVAHSAATWVWTAIGYGLFCKRELFFRLRLEGYDVCTHCGYWLSGLDESVDRCPECGGQREETPDATTGATTEAVR